MRCPGHRMYRCSASGCIIVATSQLLVNASQGWAEREQYSRLLSNVINAAVVDVMMFSGEVMRDEACARPRSTDPCEG